MKRCPYCNSIWVCWNWIHQTKEILIQLNPHLNIKNDMWGHECWECSGCNETGNKVTGGIPYWLLKFIYKYFRRS